MAMQEASESARAQLEPEWQRAFAWVEDRLGGRVVRFERHPRWRPAFYMDVERGDETLPIYFRGDRGHADHGVYPLQHELRVLQLLEQLGIAVPHVHGLCEDPLGIVMERVPGRPNLSTADSREEAAAVLDQYVDMLVQLHAIGPGDAGVLGLPEPKDAHALGLGDFDRWERTYRSQKLRPEPMIEFGIRWVRANVPEGRERVALLQGDAGQFLFEKGRLTAMIDLELATLGDPAADLAGLFTRDLSEPMGDLSHALARYAQRSGEPVDERVVRFHAIRFGICTPMSVAHLVAAPTPELDLVQYLAWYWVYGRTPLEWIARLEGIDLEPWAPPEPTATRHSGAHEFLLGAIDALPAEEPFALYQREVASRCATYLRRADACGPALEVEDLDEAGALLGERPADWQEADVALEKLATRAGDPARDADLLRLLHRRCLRQEWLLEPVMRELQHVSFQEFSV